MKKTYSQLRNTASERLLSTVRWNMAPEKLGQFLPRENMILSPKTFLISPARWASSESGVTPECFYRGSSSEFGWSPASFGNDGLQIANNLGAASCGGIDLNENKKQIRRDSTDQLRVLIREITDRAMHMKLQINIDVDDLERGIAFYQNALGFTLRRRLFDGTVAEMTGASSSVYLLTRPSGSSASPNVAAPRDYRRHWTPVHADFEVEDIEAAVQRALSCGAKLEGGIQTFTWGRIAMMSDPFGHGFCILQFVGAGYDNVA